MKRNNSWYSIENLEITYIFIHGVLSNSEKCWTNQNKTYWPDLIKSDPRFFNGSIFLSGYNTNANSGIYDIRQCAIEVLESLKLKRGDEPRPIDFKKLVFVCHSLGGIVCRHLLELEPSLFKNKKVGLVLLASPSDGSDYADSIKGLTHLLNHKVATELRKSSPKLKDIDNRFRDLLNRKDIELHGAEACEQKGPKLFGVLPIRTKRVVDESSASRYFGGVRVLPETDHASISKPSDREHCSHQFLCAFIQNTFGEDLSQTSSPAITSRIKTGNTENVLFDSFNENHRTVYSVRSIDSKIEAALRHRSLWIHGPSGSGKTTAARHAIMQLQESQTTTEIPLSQHNIETLTQGDLYKEIVESINPESAIASPSLQATVNAILTASTSSTVPLFFDEVGISKNGNYKKIFDTISQILSETKSKNEAQINFIVCSINEPNFNSASEKFREYFEKIELPHWSEIEQSDLIELIIKKLKMIKNDNDLTSNLIASSKGSPRFIKTFFRNLHKDKVSAIDKDNTRQYIESTTNQLRGML